MLQLLIFEFLRLARANLFSKVLTLKSPSRDVLWQFFGKSRESLHQERNESFLQLQRRSFSLKRERNAMPNSAPYQRPSYVRCSTYCSVFESYLIRLIHTSCFESVDVNT